MANSQCLEEAKEIEEIKSSKALSTNSALEKEKKVFEFVGTKEQVVERTIAEPEVNQKRFRKSDQGKSKKKKKRRKKAQDDFIASFFNQIDHKAATQTPMLPIEEYFLTGDMLPISRRNEFALVLRLTQTHFKAFDCVDKAEDSEITAVSEANQKFYAKRYYLFSKYDQGIRLDEESWYSVTPEEIAEYIAKKCKCNCILDAFCGAGSNSIQFARYSNKVYANDISPLKTDMALHNAKIYQVDTRITFLNKDFLALDKVRNFEQSIDVVFISPPWGGTSYSKELVYNLEQIKPNFEEVLRKALLLANNVVLFLPRNTNLKQLESILFSHESLFPVSYESFATVEALIKGSTKISALVVFIGPLFKPKTQELFGRLKKLFKQDFESYQGIIVQNIIKGKSFTFCYEMARQCQKAQVSPSAYIAKLRQTLTEDEWNAFKKLHKVKRGNNLNVKVTQPECIIEASQ